MGTAAVRRYGKFVGLGLLVVVVLLAISIGVRKSIPDEFIGAQRAYLNQLEGLLAGFDSLSTGQRIALVGSSPVIMGMSAEQIETATGVPTRNLALDASRSVFQDYVTLVAEHIRPGDVVVIANPNLRKSPQMQLPLSCVKHFGFECIRYQEGFLPHIVQDSLVLFTNQSFGDETLARTAHGDFIFPEKVQFTVAPPKFAGPFPANSAGDMAKLAAIVRSHGGCPIFVLTPFWPEENEVGLWQNEIDRLWQGIDAAGLHDIVVPDSPLWNERTLFHHDEHPSERGREIWSRAIIAKLQERGLPASCERVNARAS